MNWSACLPPPIFTLEHWRSHFGLPFDFDNLRPYIKEVVDFLRINRNDRFNTSARIMKLGCEQLGYRWDVLPNNTHHCRECGSCGVGCPYDRKQSAIVRWLPKAVEAGATVYTDTRVDRLESVAGVIREVQASFLTGKTVRNGRTLTVKPRIGTLLAAGAIGTPAILLRSKINPNRLVGKFTHIHPTTICIGRYAQPTFPSYGVPDNMYSDQFGAGESGYLMETGSFSPTLMAAGTLDCGEKLRQVMRNYYPNGAILYAHHCSGFNPGESYGTVKLNSHQEPELEYKLASDNIRMMKHSLIEMTRIHLEAKASSVYHLTNPSLEIRSKDDLRLLDDLSFASRRTTLFTVHVMGGCRMSGDESRSVVRPDFTVRGLSNLWVVDGSAFPTGLGANPQVTIYSLALWASHGICEKFQKPFVLHSEDKEVVWPWKEE